MKKFGLIFIIIIFFLISTRASSYSIPKDNIRIRVIASSDSKYDQEVKIKVKKLLEYKMYELLKNVKGIDNARKVINNNFDELNQNIGELMKNEAYSYNINFGQNYFPEKKYKGIIYDEGYYESLVVTLGEGKGSNWWCVLFPPLCLIEAEESSDVEYKFFVQELIEKYL
ncbi:MAG: stage II sporulation protein R [Bacilli bacterium]|nr:stage II sporulation protein R [Bacilli bacterium]